MDLKYIDVFLGISCLFLYFGQEFSKRVAMGTVQTSYGPKIEKLDPYVQLVPKYR